MRPSYWGNEADAWEHCIPRDTSVTRAAATARLLSSQFAYFGRLDERSTDPLEELLGGDWKNLIMKGLGFAFARHQVHDLFAVHPASQPCYGLPLLTRLDPDDPAAKPTGDARLDLAFRVETEAVSVDPLDLPTRLTWLPTYLSELHAPILEYLFDEAITFCMHSALAQALEVVEEPNTRVTMGQTLVDIAELERQKGFSRSGLLPNVAVCSHARAAGLQNQQIVRVMPQHHFPGDRLLLLNKGAHAALFGSIAWVPYVFQFLPNDAVKKNGMSMVLRQKVVITNPKSICVAELRD